MPRRVRPGPSAPPPQNEASAPSVQAPSYAKQLAGKIGSIIDSAKKTLTFNAPKDVDDLIKLFSDLAKCEEPILLGKKENAHGIKEYPLGLADISLFDLEKIVSEITQKHKEFFNLDQLGSHTAVFEDLLKNIRQEIIACQAVINRGPLTKDSAEDLHIDAKTGQVRVRLSKFLSPHLDKASTKLRQIKMSSHGYLSVSYWAGESYPQFEHILSGLHSLQKSIINHPQDPSTFLTHYENLKELLESADYSGDIIFKRNATEAKKILQNTLELFERFKTLPAPLQTDSRFSPSVRDLHEQILELTKLIGVNTALSAKAKEFLKDIYQNFKNKVKETVFSIDIETEKHHSLEIFHAALTYFGRPDAVEPKGGREALLKELAQDTSRGLDGFEAAFNSHLKGKSPYQKIDHLTIAFKRSLVDLVKKENPEAQVTPELSFETLAGHLSHAPSSLTGSADSKPSALNSFAEYAISLLSKSGGIVKEATISLVGTGFLHILKHPTFQKWIQRQTPENKGILEKFLSKTEQSLAEAIQSKKASNLLSFFKTFLEEYNSYQFSIDGFELPTLSREMDETLPVTESTQDKLLGMIKPMAQLDHEVASEKDYEKETHKQAKLLSENCAHFLTYNLISRYFFKSTQDPEDLTTKKPSDDQVFFDIITRVKLAPEGQDPNELFIHEMKSLIDRNRTNISSPIRWILKYTIPLIHKWSMHHIGRFIDRLLHYISHELDNVDEKSVKSDRSRHKLIHRVNHGIGLYQNMLKKWAEIGGDKKTVLEKLSRDKDFNEGYSDLSLMNAVGTNAVDRFLAGVDTTQGLRKAAQKLQNFITHPILAPEGIVKKVINGALILVKGIILGVPGGLILGIGFVFGLLFKLIINTSIRVTLKHTLSKSNFLNMIIEGTKDSIYEQNPYVNVITETLADQLEHLSKALDGLDAESKREVSKGKLEIADQTKRLLQETFENMVELLNKNRFNTSDKLQSYIREKSRSDQAVETLDELVMPGVIDAVIEASVIASRSLLKKNLLEKQVYTLIEKTNQAITTNPKTSPEEREKLRQKYIHDENRLKMYLEKILKQIIKQAVDSKLKNFGQRQHLETEAIRGWIQKTLFQDKVHEGHSLLIHWKNQLHDLYEHQNTIDPDVMLSKLKVIKQESSAFLHELMNRLSSIDDSSLSSKSKDKLNKTVEPLLQALQMFVGEDQFIKLYHNTETLAVVANDSPIVERIGISHQVIHEQFDHIKTLNPEDNLEAIQASLLIIKHNMELAQEGQEMIDMDKIRSKVDEDAIQEISSSLASSEYNTFKNRQVVLSKLCEDLHHLKVTKDTFAELLESKVHMIHDAELLQNRFLNALHLRDHVAYRTAKKSLQSIIGTIHDQDYRLRLQQLLLEFDQLSTVEELQAKLTIIDNEIGNMKTDHQESLDQILDQSSEFSKNLSKSSRKLTSNWMKTHNKVIKENADIIQDNEDSLLTIISNLRRAAKHLQPIELVHIQTPLADHVKHISEKAAYARLKPKTDQVFFLLQNSSFALHLAKQVFLIPFAQ